MSDLLSNLQDTIAEGGTAGLSDSILGPTPDYTVGLVAPRNKGVGDAGTMDQVFTNAGAIRDYVNNLVVGPRQGNQYFMDTGGSCVVDDPKDPNHGKTVPRSTWINNRMGGDDIGNAFPGMGPALGGSLQNFEGIIPGMMGDVVATNPVTIMNALVLPGTPKCKAYSCPVTDRYGGSAKTKSHYIVYGLEQSAQKCTRAKTAPIAAAVTEAFEPLFAKIQIKREPLHTAGTTLDQILFAGAVLLIAGLIIYK